VSDSAAEPTSAVLLDTMAFILWHADSPRLGRAARRVMHEALTRPIYVSAVSAFEISTKVRLGKLEVPDALLDDFAYVVAADGFRLAALDAVASVQAGRLISAHRDPFDRLLAAQALELNASVASADHVFAEEFGLKTVW
jgi:PIN domain nuclease of toxin-antitoxin system